MFRRRKESVLPYIEVLKDICKDTPKTVLYDEDRHVSFISLEYGGDLEIKDDFVISSLATKFTDHQITISPMINSLNEITDVQIIMTKKRGLFQ